MKIPEHNQRTIERILDKYIALKKKKKIDDGYFFTKSMKVIRYGFRKGYIENMVIAFDMFKNKVFPNLHKNYLHSYYKEYFKQIEEEKKYGPRMYPLISPHSKKFIIKNFGLRIK